MASERLNVYKEVWDVLSNVDVSEHIETKAGLSYLSWAWAWGVLMKTHPDAEYLFMPEFFYPDGTCKVECIIDIRGKTRSMWLPVMDYRNKAIENPTSRDISDARMRCLVKCIAMWGLGHYIYAGEDLPAEPTDAPKEPQKKATTKKKDPPKAAKSNGKEHPVVIATRDLLVAGATSEKDLTQLWASNVREYDALDKPLYDAVVKVFSERKAVLKMQQEGK